MILNRKAEDQIAAEVAQVFSEYDAEVLLPALALAIAHFAQNTADPHEAVNETIKIIDEFEEEIEEEGGRIVEVMCDEGAVDSLEELTVLEEMMEAADAPVKVDVADAVIDAAKRRSSNAYRPSTGRRIHELTPAFGGAPKTVLVHDEEADCYQYMVQLEDGTLIDAAAWADGTWRD